MQGSHIVVRKLYDHDRCYIFQNADGRIFFAIPYEQDFTLIGTTDRDYEGDPADVRGLARGDRLHLPLGQRIFRQAGDRRTTSSGPIRACGRSTTRATAPPRRRRATTCCRSMRTAAGRRCSRVFGGKLTTYRKLAEHALALLGAASARSLEGQGGLDRARGRCRAATSRSTASTALVAEIAARAGPFWRPPHARRLARLYGTEARRSSGARAPWPISGAISARP